MRRWQVIIGPNARADLADLYDWIADSATAFVADGYLSRVLDFIDGLDLALNVEPAWITSGQAYVSSASKDGSRSLSRSMTTTSES